MAGPTVTVSIDNTDLNLAHDTATVTFTFTTPPPLGFTLANTTAVGGRQHRDSPCALPSCPKRSRYKCIARCRIKSSQRSWTRDVNLAGLFLRPVHAAKAEMLPD
jgi:hypothetical protein